VDAASALTRDLSNWGSGGETAPLPVHESDDTVLWPPHSRLLGIESTGANSRIRIENVVVSASLAEKFDLGVIAEILEHAQYDPDQFPGLVYRMQHPRTAVLLFRSGNAVCTGGKSCRQSEQAIRLVSEKILGKGGRLFNHPKIQIQNIVATSDLGRPIDLNRIALALGLDRVEYEPEQFPGLVCRMRDPTAVVLLFGSGKLVCTGARCPADLEATVRKIAGELRSADLL
jgi:transcription initiation factor TFIID TATA-box-binding protein